MDDCVFCKIAAGEIETKVVAEDDEFLAFHDMNPQADTHVLVVPREHHADLDAFAAAGADGTKLLGFASRTAQELGVAGGYRLITNVGPAAGQTVFHLHWHILAGGKLPGFSA